MGRTLCRRNTRSVLEDGYASAQLLNQWMQAEDDTLLNEHFKAVQGTMGGSEVYRTFYKQIKQNCPETVFMEQISNTCIGRWGINI